MLLFIIIIIHIHELGDEGGHAGPPAPRAKGGLGGHSPDFLGVSTKAMAFERFGGDELFQLCCFLDERCWTARAQSPPEAQPARAQVLGLRMQAAGVPRSAFVGETQVVCWFRVFLSSNEQKHNT